MIRSVLMNQTAPNVRVWLDGRDVTHDCQVAIADEPDEAGAVLLLTRNARGRAYLDPQTREVARTWHYGEVRIQDDSVR